MIDFSRVDAFTPRYLNRIVLAYALDGYICDIDAAGNFVWTITSTEDSHVRFKANETALNFTERIDFAWSLVELVKTRYSQEVFINFNIEMLKYGGWISDRQTIAPRICRAFIKALYLSGQLDPRKDCVT